MSDQEHAHRPPHLAAACARHPITLATLWLGLPMVGMVLFGTGLLVGHWWRSPVPPEPREHLRMSVGAGLSTMANPQHVSALSAATAEPALPSPEQQGAAPTGSASVSSVSATAPHQTVVPPLEPDVEGWDVIQESKTPHDFVEFLTAFPASRLVPHALQRLCQLHTVPGLGVLDAKAVKAVNFLLVVFAGGVVSMATVLSEAHALTPLANLLGTWHEALLSDAWRATIALYWGGFLFHFLVGSEFTMVSTLLPVLLNVAATQGYNLAAMGMLWVFAGSGKLFVYQNTGLILGYSYGFFTTRDLLKVGAVLTVIEGFLILGLVPVYWPLVGLAWKTAPVAQPAVHAEASFVEQSGGHDLKERSQLMPSAATEVLHPAPTASTPIPSAEPDPETAAWARVRHSTSPQDLAAFLAAYPATRFAFAARMRLLQLQRQTLTAPPEEKSRAPLRP